MKALKLTISGSYRTASKDIIDFEHVSGIVPFVDEDIAKMHAQARYAARWIKDAKVKGGAPAYPERIEDIRTISVDDIEEVDVEDFSYIGKSIHEMTHEEIQDLATAKDIRAIPLYKAEDLRETRIKAYKFYSEVVLNKLEVKINEEAFNFSKLTPIIVDGAPRRQTAETISNEEVIALEGKNSKATSIQSSLNRGELLEIAAARKIDINPAISDDDLYKKLFQS